jgi:phosphoribosylanthranilate isomerase
VFVRATLAGLEQVLRTVPLDVVQLHGSSATVPALRVWQAIAPDEAPVANISAEACLMDSLSAEFGGSGRTFDWREACGLPFPVIIAGGLDGDNVGRAIEIARPWGVDACSRLECRPGRKDPRRVAAFTRAALRAFQELEITKQ